MPIVQLHGHAPLRRRLLDSLGRGTLPASLLLHGPRGVGKQRLALWLGQALLCTGDDPPCGRCQHCRYAGELTHPDLHWYFPRPRLKDADASTSEVVEDYAGAIADRVKAGGLYPPADGTEGVYVSTVRAIVQQSALAPALARRKVFVIGDAERMVPQEGSEQAANALLKLLEEPSEHTTIVLTTSEPGALLPTIKSRVVCLRVPLLGEEDVRAFLADPVVTESLGAGGAAADDRRVSEAAGAPGRLVGDDGRSAARAAAERIYDAARKDDPAPALRLSLSQGVARSRGAYSDMLDALVALLHGEARQAVRRRDERFALAASRAIDHVEEAKAMAQGNVMPMLITASLIRDLRDTLR